MDVTKDHLMDVTTAVETTLVYGSFYFFYAVAVTTVLVLAEADVTMAVVMIAAYGLSSSYSSAAATEWDGTTMVVAVIVVATTAAANSIYQKAFAFAEALHILCSKFIYFDNEISWRHYGRLEHKSNDPL